MRCVELEKFLQGSSRPFVAKDQSGEQWVIKAHEDIGDTKSLFNEYVAGRLANAIELPWPTVRIAELAPQIVNQLKQADFPVKSKWAVGLKYMQGLTPFEIGSDGIAGAARQIRSRFAEPALQAPFYGKCLFDNWVLLEDLKADTLQIRSDGKPMFVDASMAFGGGAWREERLKWVPRHFKKGAIYLEEIISDTRQFEPWLDRVDSVSVSLLSQILDTVPSDWPVKKGFVAATMNFLSSTQQMFLPQFRDSLEWIV